MSKTEEGPFLDLASYTRVDVPEQIRGNIIKAAHISIGGTEKVGVLAGMKDDPVVVLRKEGERVTSAEFVCKCGRSVILEMDYEQE